MTTISLLNRKGGAGKTTASVNLAAIFAKTKNKKVLLVDFDPQANASTYLGKFISKDEVSVYDVVCENMDANKAIIDTGIEGLKLLPANLNLDKADTMIAAVPIAKEYLLRGKLAEIADQYDYCFIDCPPARNNLTTNALTASDYAILPCEATEYGVDSMIAMSEFVSGIRQYVNQNLKIAGILFAKKENTSSQNFYYEQMKEMLKDYHFFSTDIRKTTIVEKSLNWHQPLITYGERENVTKDYLSVADELESIMREGK